MIKCLIILCICVMLGICLYLYVKDQILLGTIFLVFTIILVIGLCCADTIIKKFKAKIKPVSSRTLALHMQPTQLTPPTPFRSN